MLVAVSRLASVTLSNGANEPAAVGVPDTTPVEGSIVTPAGKVPLDSDHVYGAVPLLITPAFDVYALLICPVVGRVGHVTDSKAPMENEANVLDAVVTLPVTASVTMTVTTGVNEPDTVGVPATAPEDELIVSPAGNPVADHAAESGAPGV
ncbi:MAG: hypothetical protein QOJ08_1336 [Ilumatobacteraceae bacterium]